MADNNIPQYPYMFSADQFSNRFSPFQGKAFPWPSQYSGTPTDALGRPIQSYMDAAAQNAAAAQPAQAPPVSLNTTPGSYGQPGTNPWATLQAGGATPDQMAGFMSQMQPTYGTSGVANPNYSRMMGRLMAGVGGQNAQPSASSASGGGGGIDMNQAYLNALANPGKVVTPGAKVTPSPAPSGQSGVLQQFLANWQPQTGAGGYSNAGFLNALRGQV
jgi:hypothetical protein